MPTIVFLPGSWRFSLYFFMVNTWIVPDTLCILNFTLWLQKWNVWTSCLDAQEVCTLYETSRIQRLFQDLPLFPCFRPRIKYEIKNLQPFDSFWSHVACHPLTVQLELPSLTLYPNSLAKARYRNVRQRAA